MITKEFKLKKYCCLYASDFHLEMILLPYVKKNINKFKIVILTEEDLSESIKQVLDRTNLPEDEKNKILNLNWGNKKEDFSNIEEFTSIIVNGKIEYINKVNDEIKNMGLKNINIINCFNINEIQKSQEKDPQTPEEAEKYFSNLNEIYIFQKDISEKEKTY